MVALVSLSHALSMASSSFVFSGIDLARSADSLISWFISLYSVELCMLVSFPSHRCSDNDHAEERRCSFHLDAEVLALIRAKVCIADPEPMLFP